MADVLQNLLSKVDLLIVFMGMAVLLWRSLSALQSSNSENVSLTQMLAQLLVGQPVKVPTTPAALSAAKPGTVPPKPVTTPEVPDEAIDQGLVDFIKKMEGFRATAYWDYKQYSIGYGTKATSATEVIDQAEGERRLRAEIVIADNLVKGMFPTLPKGIHQALIDLTYNAGSGWEHQSLGAAVKAEKWDTVKADILQYNHAGGQVNAGLTTRREAEITWFDHPL
jgi:GH24 family phage-related lysozyme (muramidase)